MKVIIENKDTNEGVEEYFNNLEECVDHFRQFIECYLPAQKSNPKSINALLISLNKAENVRTNNKPKTVFYIFK